MSTRLLLGFLLIGMATPVVAAPLPRVALAPPPHDKPPAPWKRIDLIPHSEGKPSEPRSSAMRVLWLSQIEKYQIALGQCMPRSMTAADLDRVRQSGSTAWRCPIVFESKSCTEVVVFGEEEPLRIGGALIPGRVAVTLACREKGKYQVTGIHIGEAASFQPLIAAFYEANPTLRPPIDP
jgi:hypothetical protein